jgi:phage gpG-like protein
MHFLLVAERHVVLLLLGKYFNMSEIKISFDDKEFRRKIDSLDKSVKNFKQPLEEIGSELQDYYGRKVFNTQGAELGQRWKPLSASTVLARQMRRGHYAKVPRETNKILVWTGNLQDGFKKKVTSTRLVISNAVNYFKYNQLTRPMLGITNTVIKTVEDKINDYLKKSIR